MIIGASSSGGVLFFVVIAFAVVYLIFVRPQRKRQAQAQQLVSELRVGDEALTAGGMYGTIVALDEDVVTLEIAPQTEVRVARRAIAGVTTEPEPEDAEPVDPTTDPTGPISDGEPSDEKDRG